MANEQAMLRGFDMPVLDIGDQLHFRMPLLSFSSGPTLYIAGRVDWQADKQALTTVDDPEDREMATLLTDGVSRHVASGQGVVVAGAEFFHAASRVGHLLDDFCSPSATDCECWIRMATPAEFVKLKGELVDESRAVFDHELGKASRQGSRLTERGNGAMLILRRCGPLRRDDLAIRQLAAARQNRDFDLYRRLLTRFEHELGEPENRLHRQAGLHIELANPPEGTWRWLDMPESKAELVNVLAEPSHSIRLSDRADLAYATFEHRVYRNESFSDGVVEVPIVDDPFRSSLKGATAGLRYFTKEQENQPTSSMVQYSELKMLAAETKIGREETWS